MELRDSLAADVTVGYDYALNQGIPCDLPIADAVLRSPELQQIKNALFRMAIVLSRQGFSTPRDALVNFGLRDSVIEWVLS